MMNVLSWILAIGMVLLAVAFLVNQVLTIVFRIKHKGYTKKDLFEVLDQLRELNAVGGENKQEEE